MTESSRSNNVQHKSSSSSSPFSSFETFEETELLETSYELDPQSYQWQSSENGNAMNDHHHKIGIQIADKSALHCKNDCGYFGNREWDGYCSICYKRIRQSAEYCSINNSPQLEADSGSPSVKPSHLSTLTSSSFMKLPEMITRAPSASSISSSLSFRKFEEKKKVQTDKKSLKNIFKRTSTSSTSQTSVNLDFPDNNNGWQLNFPFDKKMSIFGEEVLAKLFKDSFRDINVNVNKCVDRIGKMLNKSASIEELTESIHDFYNMMLNHFQTSSQYREASTEQLDQLVDQTETLLMSKLYPLLFNRVQAEEEERDLQLQNKIRSLNWIMPCHLDIEIDLRHPKVKDLLDKAITEIIELDSRHVPYQKLQSVVSCSKTLFELLQVNGSEAISADQFLPALVFLVINANPPLLQSNIKFITRFSTPSRLIKGEAGYYFTNLCCATAFIEKICGDSLNMSETDFQSYINGESQPPGHYKQSFLCEAFRILNSNLSSLNVSIEKQALCEQNINSLTNRLEELSESLESRSREAIESSKKVVDEFLNGPMFDDDFNPQMLPSYIRELYADHSQINGQQLIDIEKPIEESVSVPTDHVAQSSSSLPPSAQGLLEDECNSVDLPPPLSPQVISNQITKNI